MRKRERKEKCPACGHDVEIGKNTKIRRKEKDYLRVECDICGDIFPIDRKVKNKRSS